VICSPATTMCQHDEAIAHLVGSHRTRRDRASVATMRRSAPSIQLIVPLAAGIVPRAASEEHLASDEVNVCKCELLWILRDRHPGMSHRHRAGSEFHRAVRFRTRNATHPHRASSRCAARKSEATWAQLTDGGVWESVFGAQYLIAEDPARGATPPELIETSPFGTQLRCDGPGDDQRRLFHSRCTCTTRTRRLV
jgi:hypothetical protein